MGTIHVIGAGIAGLSCAVRCAQSGHAIVLYEAAPRAGGRCRSFEDEGLGCTIDNGNHLVLSGNNATKVYLNDIGGNRSVREVNPARFPFVEPNQKKSYDLLPYMKSNGELHWEFRPGSSFLPFWLMMPNRRVPETRPGHYLEVLKLRRATKGQTVADCVDRGGPLFERFWQPMTRAVLNTDAEEASASLLWKTIKMTFLKGESACRPLIFTKGLSAALVTPALHVLANAGAIVRFQSRARGLRWQKEGVIALRFPEGLLKLDRDDAVVLAVPPDICAELWPEANPPQETRPIVNVHFRVSSPVFLPGGQPFLGLIGRDAQWLFSRGNVLSVTISSATEFIDRPNWEIANQIWTEIDNILGQNMGRMPPWRVIKERRATIAQTPDTARRRPGTETILPNLFLAGDWTDTGLPATIESSVQSGFAAARFAIGNISRKIDHTH
ncbi:hydroxysqualene dehydroxylase HpnE [Alphaproteobacteria bacterium]|nr:hydroxysqualene dehydroxylase HpnE [Alphaproteobacteria bacterium]